MVLNRGQDALWRRVRNAVGGEVRGCSPLGSRGARDCKCPRELRTILPSKEPVHIKCSSGPTEHPECRLGSFPVLTVLAPCLLPVPWTWEDGGEGTVAFWLDCLC